MLTLTEECLAAAHGHPPVDAQGKTPVSIPVFRNRFIENYLARAYWVTPILWFGPIIAGGLFRGLARLGAVETAALFLGGWLLWTLTEYLLHRFLFHFEAKTPDEEVRLFLMHGYHHEFPNDPLRLVAPPVMSFGPAVVFGLVYFFTLGPDRFLTAMAGTSAGYVAYDWIHYYTHHARPRWALGKWLRRYHMLHHFAQDESRFGVSSPLWDLVFGTYRRGGKINRYADHAASSSS